MCEAGGALFLDDGYLVGSVTATKSERKNNKTKKKKRLNYLTACQKRFCSAMDLGL